MAKLKRYLTEVVYINGADEFKSYKSYTTTVIVDENKQSLDVQLNHKEVDKESISVYIENRYDLPIYFKSVNTGDENTISLYLGNGESFLKEDKVVITYTALNTVTSDLYSVDYENGILYLASETNINLDIEYKCYNTLVKAKKAKQLNEDEYRVDDNATEVFNYDNTIPYRLVYNYNNTSDEEYSTPVIRNLKVNYINTSEEETFLWT